MSEVNLLRFWHQATQPRPAVDIWVSRRAAAGAGPLGGQVPEADALFTIAEVAVGITGFSGIVLAISHRPGALDPFDASRIFLLLAAGVATIVVSLFPVGLHAAGVASGSIWRWSSASMVVVNLGVIAGGLRAGPWVVSARDWVIAPVLLTATLFNLAAQILNATGLVFHGSFSVFFFGLLWWVTFSGTQFVLIIFVRPRDT